jgi:hypothetical protein
MESLDVLKAQLVVYATPFMSAKTLLNMRDRRLCNPGEKLERWPL